MVRFLCRRTAVGLRFLEPSAVRQYVSQFPPETQLECVIRPHRYTRSSQANRRYWALITAAARELGYDDPEELHEGVAMKFLAQPELVAGIPRRLSTPTLNTAEFSDYMAAVERFFQIDLHLDLSAFTDPLS